MYLTVEKDNLSEIMNSHPKVFAMFGAQWCEECKELQPKFEKLATENPTITYVYIDNDDNPLSRQMVDSEKIPHFALFYDGNFYKEESTDKWDAIETLNKELLELNYLE